VTPLTLNDGVKPIDYLLVFPATTVNLVQELKLPPESSKYTLLAVNIRVRDGPLPSKPPPPPDTTEDETVVAGHTLKISASLREFLGKEGRTYTILPWDDRWSTQPAIDKKSDTNALLRLLFTLQPFKPQFLKPGDRTARVVFIHESFWRQIETRKDFDFLIRQRRHPVARFFAYGDDGPPSAVPNTAVREIFPIGAVLFLTMPQSRC
jgi:hypothetical protein